MRTKITLILLFLNVALFYYIFYIHGLSGREQADPNRVLGPETANIQSIEIAPADPAGAVRLERRGEIWWLTRPLEWPANEFAVSRIVNELQSLKDKTSFAVADLGQSGQTLADYGLEKPSLTVTFAAAPASAGSPAPKPVTLKIGDVTKVGNLLYVLSPDGRRVHVVGRSLAESLSLRLADLRSNSLFTIPVFEVRSFNLQTTAAATSKIRLRNENNRWSFEAPINARASKTATVLAINGLNALRVKTFLDPHAIDPARTGLATPSLQITLEGNSRRETLLIGAQVENPEAQPSPDAASAETAAPTPTAYYAKMEDKTPVFEIVLPSAPGELLDTLRNAQDKLRDTHVLDLEPSTVTAINLTAPNQPDLTLQRLESASANPATAAWQGVRRSAAQSPQTFPADRAVVQQLLQKLQMLSADAFVSDAPSAVDLENYGFNRPIRNITLSLTPTQAGPTTAQLSTVTLQIGSAAGPNPAIYARSIAQPFVYRVSDDILRETPLDPLAYRERLLRDLPAGAQITALKLTDLSNNNILLETTLPLPADGKSTPAQRQAIETLAAQLRVLRAKNFVRDPFTPTIAVDGVERPWRYRLDLTLTLVGGSGTQTQNSVLNLSEQVGGSLLYVGSPESEFNLVFTAEQPLLDALFAVIYAPRDPGPTLPQPDAPAAPAPQPVAPAATTP